MLIAYTSTIIDAPIGRVWPHLRNFGALASYQSSVAKLTLEGAPTGDQIGSVRNLVLHEGKFEGKRLRERLLALSDVDYSATYSVDMDEPAFNNAICIYRLRSITDRDATFIEWSTYGDMIDLNTAPAVANFIVNEIYADCFRGLRALVENK